MGRRIALAVVIALLVSVVVGGAWSFLGMGGSPGPVFGIAFGVVFGLVFARARQQE